MPIEAEWQWAAMGARDDKNQPFAGSNGKNSVDDYAWHYANAGDFYLDSPWSWDDVLKNRNRTQPVKTKRPNDLGIYDMSGNVWELCWDNYDQYPLGKLVDYRGPDNSDARAYRGGGWHYASNYCAVALRYMVKPEFTQPSVGIRVVRSIK